VRIARPWAGRIRVIHARGDTKNSRGTQSQRAASSTAEPFAASNEEAPMGVREVQNGWS